MTDDNCNYLFVYGTLKRGQRNHHLIEHLVDDIQPVKTKGILYNTQVGFPVMFESDEGLVHGELISFNKIDLILEITDRLEGYLPFQPAKSHYLRVTKHVWLYNDKNPLSSWMYIYPSKKHNAISKTCSIIQNGCWKSLL